MPIEDDCPRGAKGGFWATGRAISILRAREHDEELVVANGARTIDGDVERSFREGVSGGWVGAAANQGFREGVSASTGGEVERGAARVGCEIEGVDVDAVVDQGLEDGGVGIAAVAGGGEDGVVVFDLTSAEEDVHDGAEIAAADGG